MSWLANTRKVVGLAVFFGIMSAVVLSACEPPSEVGITPPNEIGILYTDTITVKVSTVLMDSVRTNSGQFLMSGNFKDPAFGTVSAAAFFEFSPRKLTFAANSVYDSTYLFLRFAYAFGDTSQTQEFFLHRTRDTLQNKTYYSTNSLEYDPKPLGSVKFVPNQGRIVLVGKIPDDLGRSVFGYKGDTTTAPAFRNFMKGYALVPSPRNTALFGFLPSSSGTGVDIYTHIAGVDTRRTLSLSLEPTAQSFSQTTAPSRFNNIKADRRGTVLSNLRPLVPVLPKDLQGRLYVQDAIGIMTKVEFPFFANLYKNGKIAVNRAELSIRPVFSTAADVPAIKPILTLVQSDANNRIARNTLEQVLFLPDDASTFSSFPGQQAAAFDPRFRTYTFQMGTYLQALITGFKKNNGLLLSPTQPVDVGGGRFTYILNQRFDRLIFDSKPETFKLVVFYTNVR